MNIHDIDKDGILYTRPSYVGSREEDELAGFLKKLFARKQGSAESFYESRIREFGVGEFLSEMI